MRAKQLDESVRLLQQEAEGKEWVMMRFDLMEGDVDVTVRRQSEDKEISDETELLTAEVTRIQDTISQFMDSYKKFGN